MFEQLFAIMKKMENDIGNGAKISVSIYDEGLRFDVVWVVGGKRYNLTHKLLIESLVGFDYEELFVIFFTRKCKIEFERRSQ